MAPLEVVNQLAIGMAAAKIPYKWGGNNPLEGLDCSGFAQILGRAAGIDPPGDQTAQAFSDKLAHHGKWLGAPQRGAFLFYGESLKKIIHVAYALNPYQIAEAGGGGSHVRTLEDAIKYNAYVRVRHVDERRDRAGIIMPDYSKVGMLY